ncbi:G1 family endopeptidase [Paenibacillus sp. F6_3S_P_1C]|uniref:G1 family endopeptidase n=1 Tax=Paenibacillus vandeheii TaxID=3035917 RepID=A0ABT8J6Y5_9BACL|nr:G1 family glutamic endopeptidase [Paenibacillus vandeheii]MDN4600849.1 G1 family endopeptidase [Paenibacillus vandeheii]
MLNNRNKRRKPCIPHTGKTNSPLSFGWISSNWSGYARAGYKGEFKRISAEWNVPFVLPSSKSSYSSAWIGIDGYENSNLIQTGTGHDWVNGKASYYAWWEILPDVETVIPFPVSPGDRIRATIYRINRTRWCITLHNLTQSWTFRTVQQYTGQQSSAEWIVEAPSVGSSISRMARISPVTFKCCRLNGCSPGLVTKEKGIMIQQKQIVSIPGAAPGPRGDSFVVKRND